jgi:hypothetical protein
VGAWCGVGGGWDTLRGDGCVRWEVGVWNGAVCCAVWCMEYNRSNDEDIEVQHEQSQVICHASLAIECGKASVVK